MGIYKCLYGYMLLPTHTETPVLTYAKENSLKVLKKYYLKSTYFNCISLIEAKIEKELI